VGRIKFNIERLKSWAYTSLPEVSGLREILLLEEGKLGVDEFKAKMGTWLKLVKLEEKPPAQNKGGGTTN
jgi:hypothetical protein